MRSHRAVACRACSLWLCQPCSSRAGPALGTMARKSAPPVASITVSAHVPSDMCSVCSLDRVSGMARDGTWRLI